MGQQRITARAAHPSRSWSTGWRAPLRSTLLYTRSLGLVILAWWATSLWLDKDFLLPTPLAVARRALSLLLSGEVFSAALVSAQRLISAYLLAGLVGIPVGIAMGLSRRTQDLLYGLVEVLRPISGIALIPVLLVIFGISNAVPIGIIFYAAVFPFILNTSAGVRNLDARFIGAAHVLGADRRRMLLSVVLPGSIPDIVTGARIAASTAWMALIVAELIGAPSGLGYNIGFAQGLGNATLVLAWIVYVGISGYLLDASLRSLQARLTPWRVGLKVGG